jgi:hypothetical protein
MNPARLIRDLDRALAEVGQDVTLRKGNTADGEVTVRAFARGYKPADLVGDVRQGDLNVTLSPTGLDAVLPLKANDKILVAGAVKNVEQAEHVRMLDQIVRINVRARG